MYQRPPEVLALARLREDREHGEGTFAELEAFAHASRDGAARIMDRELTKSLARAEDDLRDVVKAVPALLPGPGASAWLRAVMTGKGREDDIDLAGIRTLALITVQRRRHHPGEARDALEVVSTGENVHSAIVEAPMRSMAEAVGVMEATVRRRGVAAAALCIPVGLRGDADVAAKLGICLDLGVQTPPVELTLCLLATADGARGALLALPDDVQRTRAVNYAREDAMADAYGVRA